MSTISPQFPSPPMPRHRMPDALSAQTPTDGIAATDAMSSASDSDAADTGLESNGSGTDSASLDPSGMTDRIDGLLAQQVQNGALTSDQADTLKTAFQSMGGGTEVGGAGHHPRGLPPGPPPDAADSGTPGTDPTSAAPTTSTSSTDDLLASFVKQLQTSQNRTSPYGADGARSSAQASALLLNFRA